MPAGNPSGYGSIFANAMNKPVFPGASGYGGSVKVGQVLRANQAAVAQQGRNAAQAAAMARPAGTGYGSLVNRGQVARNASNIGNISMPNYGGGPSRATGVRNVRTTAAPGRNVRGPMHGPLRPPPLPSSARAPVGAGATAGTKGMKMSRKSLLGIGLGMGVAAGVAMNRRGEGASSGRQSMYKY